MGGPRLMGRIQARTWNGDWNIRPQGGYRPIPVNAELRFFFIASDDGSDGMFVRPRLLRPHLAPDLFSGPPTTRVLPADRHFCVTTYLYLRNIGHETVKDDE